MSIFIAKPASAEALRVEAEPIQLPPLPVANKDTTFGALKLKANDRRFGGFSGICVDETGERLVAVSDRGTWLTAALRYDPVGRLTGVGQGRTGQLVGEDGKPLLYRDTDAEAIACLPDGSAIVAFERNHRLLHYPASASPFAKPPVRIPPPPGLEQLPINFGVEALADLGGGVLVAISEMVNAEKNSHSAWMRDKRMWTPFSYVPQTGFRVTDAAATTSGDLVILEHHYNPILGNVVRLAHVSRSAIGKSRRVEGRQLLMIGPRAVNVSFEGVAVRRGRDREQFVYLISDNNFQANEPTILLMLKLQAEAFATSP